MADRDSFIDEVSEEVRRDRMFGLWKRYGPFVIGAVVAVVVAAGLKAWFDAKADEAAREAGGAIVAAGDAPVTETAAALLAVAETAGHEGAAVLARLRAAGVQAAQGDSAAAAAIYDRVAKDPATDSLLKEFASLRALILRADTMEASALADALQPSLSGPFRLMALEAQGLALHRAGDAAGAEAAFREIFDNPETPQGMRARVRAVMTAIGLDPVLSADG